MKSLLALFLFSSVVAHATPAVLTLSGFDQNIEDVKVAKTATFTQGALSQSMSLIGAGLRAKKIVFVPVRIYVGQFFAQDPASLKKTEGEVIESISTQKAVAMHLTFLHDVDNKRLVNSFKDGIKANKIDPNDASIQKFLEMVSQAGDVAKGSSLSVVGYRKDDKTDVIVYLDAKGGTTEVSGEPGLRQKVFSLWLGKTDDSGVAEFRKSVLK